MAVEFFNVRTGERKVVDTEPLIAAFFNSGDQHVNATLGQDFGWRLAPSTLKRIKDIQSNPTLMAQIAAQFQLPFDGVGKTDILTWISLEDARAEAAKREEQAGDYEEQYQQELRELTESPKSKSQERREAVQKSTKSTKTDSADESDSAKIDASNNNQEGK